LPVFLELASVVVQVFDVTKRQWKPDIRHHRKADDFGRRFEVTKWFLIRHFVGQTDNGPFNLTVSLTLYAGYMMWPAASI